MKKTIVALLLIVTSLGAFAKEGDVTLGPTIGFGTKSALSTPSIGIKLNYDVTRRIEVSPSFDYYIKHKGVNAWDINLDAHYLFWATDDLILYPLAGVSLFHASTEGVNGLGEADASTKFGLNLGGGIRYNLTEGISLGLELKYVLVSNWGGLTPSLNLMFRL